MRRYLSTWKTANPAIIEETARRARRSRKALHPSARAPFLPSCRSTACAARRTPAARRPNIPRPRPQTAAAPAPLPNRREQRRALCRIRRRAARHRGMRTITAMAAASRSSGSSLTAEEAQPLRKYHGMLSAAVIWSRAHRETAAPRPRSRKPTPMGVRYSRRERLTARRQRSRGRPIRIITPHSRRLTPTAERRSRSRGTIPTAAATAATASRMRPAATAPRRSRRKRKAIPFTAGVSRSGKRRRALTRLPSVRTGISTVPAPFAARRSAPLRDGLPAARRRAARRPITAARAFPSVCRASGKTAFIRRFCSLRLSLSAF